MAERSVAGRLVATDLDGTLLRSDGTVSDRTRAVLNSLDELGVPVVFTTGRPIRWMESLWDVVGGHGLAICSNGGIVYDVGSHTVRDHRAIERAAGLEVARLLREAVPGTTFAIEHTEGWNREAGFPHRSDDGPRERAGDLADLYRDDVVKLLAVHRELPAEEFHERVQVAVSHLVTTTWSSSFALVEMSAAGVTKATALTTLAAELGVPREGVIAFGDMPNDLAMLEWAGTACAMANAHPSVLAAADLVAASNDEDGVASVLCEEFDLRDAPDS